MSTTWKSNQLLNQVWRSEWQNKWRRLVSTIIYAIYRHTEEIGMSEKL